MHNPSAPSQGHNQKPAGPHAPHRPTDSPGRANPAGPGGSPQTPQGLTAPPPNRLARQGKPSRSGRQPAKPIGSHSLHRPTDSPGRANPAGPGGSPQTPQGLTHSTAQPTRPAGQTQQVRAAARKNPQGPTSLSVQRPSPGRARSSAEFPPPQAGKENGNHVLTGSAGQNILSPRECRLRRRGSGCIPQFWEEQRARQNTRHPRTLPFRTKRQPSGLLPKFLILSGFSDPYTDTTHRQ